MTDAGAELRKIEDDIRRLEELKRSGAMPEDLANSSIDALKGKRAAYLAELKGSGAVAQDGSEAVGERGVFTDGSIEESIFNTGDNVEILVGTQPRARKESLREAYLSYVLDQVRPLALSGVVRQSASEAETRMNLSAVYTALLTQGGLADADLDKERSTQREALLPTGRMLETKRLSAVEQMNRHAHLVLLGDPGSGKSTFVNFAALCLVGQALGRPDANLKALTQPLPQAEDEWIPRRERDQKPEPQPWDHGALIPVRVILRDFAARGLTRERETPSAEQVWNFLESELNTSGLGEFAPLLKKELRDTGGMILFDGLDEVPEAEHRRQQMCAAIEGFASAFPRCRYLVTSRTYAYQEQDWKLRGFEEAILAPFTKGQIASFVERWYAHIAQLRNQNVEDARGKAELLKRAVFGSDRLMGLAERPLLLTLMASLHAWRGGTLPDKREELYADAVDLLLDWWENQRVVRDPKGNITVIQPSLAEWLKVDRKKVRDLLNQLAYEAHTRQSELVGTADVPEVALIAGLMKLSQNPDVKPARLIEYLRDRAGLLIPRGVGVYTFPHRTFQEYLAACDLTDHDYPDLIAELARTQPNRWREVALLAGAKAARGADFALWSLVDAISPEREDRDAEACFWGAQIAGQAVVEIADLEKVTASTAAKLDRLRTRLLDNMENNRLPAVERAQAGINLSALGDPRFSADLWYLPADETLGFVHIPAGRFLTGSNDKDEQAQDEEKPQHEVHLPDFWMAKYLVTVAQFRRFVEGTNYPFENWRWNQIPTHPIVAVTWYDAREYTQWLDKELRRYAKQQIALVSNHPLWLGLVEGKLEVTLPSEAEWEKAARGTDGRIYPWGEEFDPDSANTAETQIGDQSVVGCFPTGASHYGLLDMSGNVWEWTRSLWGKDWSKPSYKYPYDLDDHTREDLSAEGKMLRVIRGGSFFVGSGGARCAFRLRGDPGSRINDFGFRVVVSPLLPS